MKRPTKRTSEPRRFNPDPPINPFPSPPDPPHGPDDGRAKKWVDGKLWPITDAELAEAQAIVAAAAASPIVPEQIPLWAARAALREAGSFNAIDAFVEAHKADQPTLWEAWNMGNFVPRHGLIVTTFAPQLSLTDSVLDQLFIRGGQIEAQNTASS